MLELMFEKRSRPFYKCADNMDLDAIPCEVYVNFICEKFYEKGRRMDAEVAGNVYDLFEGHTYYVQKTTNEAFFKRHKLVSASSVRAAAKKLLEEELMVEENKRHRVSDRFFGLCIKRTMPA